MLGIEMLDVILGLAFVYLLLSLVCSAINEYISALLNLRGKALIAGIEQLLDDSKDTHLKSDVLGHRLIRSMYTRSLFGNERKPSYIPARAFAMALLDAVENPSPPTAKGVAALTAEAKPPVGGAGNGKQGVREILDLLKDDALGDVVQTIGTEVENVADKALLPAASRRTVTQAVAATRTDLQKLHDSVEVWFNNAMDRVSGVYKRQTQIWLFIIGLVLAIAMNADTISMWSQLSSNQQLRDRLAATAVAQIDKLDLLAPRDDSIPPDTTHASAVYRTAMAQLDSTQLRFGWAASDAEGIWTNADPQKVLRKMMGLLMTAVALSLGAPFWFDVLNKIINIRSTGRAPNERAKNPEAAGKRPAETAPK